MIRLIAAIDEHQGLAKNGVQPWKLPSDEHYFGKQTKKYGGRVLMGRRTFEVIGHPLPGRQNFVLTREPRSIPGAVCVTDLAAFLHDPPTDLWVIGGASVYEQTLERADELYLTHIQADFGCDQFFPPYESAFKLISTDGPYHENDLTFSYTVYAKV